MAYRDGNVSYSEALKDKPTRLTGAKELYK